MSKTLVQKNHFQIHVGILIFSMLFILQSCSESKKKVYLSDLDLTKMEIGWGKIGINKSVEGNALSIAEELFERGVGTHAVSKLMIDLNGQASLFYSKVGVDDESGDNATVEFFVMGDREILWRSSIMTKGDVAREVSLPLDNIKKLALYISDGGDNINYDHANWIDTYIEYKGAKPSAIAEPKPQPYILTPASGPHPSINGPRIYGARPGSDFLYRIPISGARPIKVSVKGLPKTIKLDPETGILSGTSPEKGEYNLRIKATNSHGASMQNLTLKIDNSICLTPPLGWNSWNCWGLSVDQLKVKEAIDAMVNSGLADYGWTYINIDDGWEAEQRTKEGVLLANDKFPRMKSLADYAHFNGLKLGIYSSPGTTTCGGYLGSYEYEEQDARTWEAWGIDYLKYDWCSYGKISKDQSLAELKKPYTQMNEILFGLNRDIVYSLCQYGMGDVWTWGESVGGNLWRTTYDITDTWNSMASIGFSQDKCSPYAGPGHWNDPDMLVVGQVGWGPTLNASRLTPDEQYTHISLWCLLSAPLLIGCDMTQLDDFTLNLLTNSEALDINQDALGRQAIKVKEENGTQVWAKVCSNGDLAVGLFYTGGGSPIDAFSWDGEIIKKEITITFEELGIPPDQYVRDVWRQKELGRYADAFSAEVNFHGVSLVRISSTKPKNQP